MLSGSDAEVERGVEDDDQVQRRAKKTFSLYNEDGCL